MTQYLRSKQRRVTVPRASGRKLMARERVLKGALANLVSLLLEGGRDPIFVMRSRNDYPPELQRAIDILAARNLPRKGGRR